MPASDPVPQFTVVYPGFDVRGHAAERLRAWIGEQTLPRSHYRVVAVLNPDSKEEPDVRDELGPGDKLIYEPVESDTAMWNAGAVVSDTPWLVFTEGHSPAHPECLAALDRWLETKPDAQVGNFAIGHPDDYQMAKISDRWFGEQSEKWDNDWPRLHRAGFAIRRDVFEKLGGFQPFGQFGPPLLSAKFHAAGFKMEVVPDATVIHVDDHDLYGHHFDTIDFVRGECAARDTEDPTFFEKYFGHHGPWRNRLTNDSDRIRDAIKAASRFAFEERRISVDLIVAVRRLLPDILSTEEARLALSEAITELEESTLLHLPIPKELRYKWFVRAHRRVVETQARMWIAEKQAEDPPQTSMGFHRIDTLGAASLGGVHALEKSGDRPFRWSEPFLVLQFSPECSVSEVRIETGRLRDDPNNGVILAACGPYPLDSSCVRKEDDGTLVFSIPEDLQEQVIESGLSLLIEPINSSLLCPTETRKLGIPVFSVAIS
tara:strand:- start:1734 stop:3197 length:1464 start_codon:yes stop_codon:yes gene_type:complete